MHNGILNESTCAACTPVAAFHHSLVGEWLSLVEHLVRDQGVGGSNPLSPTNLFKQLRQFPPDPIGCNRVQLTAAARSQAPSVPS